MFSYIHQYVYVEGGINAVLISSYIIYVGSPVNVECLAALGILEV